MRQKVNISMNEDLLRLVDEYADELFTSRSGVVCQALVQFFNQQQATKALRELVPLLHSISRSIKDGSGLSEEDKKKLADLDALVRLLA